MNENEMMLRKASFGKLLLNLCIPTIIIMVVMVVYNMADVFFIGKTGNPYMIAAVSLCGPLFSILSGLGTLFGSGGCTAISLALGRNDHKVIRHITSLCFYGALLIGLLFAGIVLLNLKNVVMLIGAEETTLDYTMDYLRVIAFGAPVVMFTNVFMNLVRSDGAAKVSMIANGLGTITNIVLDPIFILVLGGGVTGAAFATVIGNAVSAVYLLWYVIKKCPDDSLRLSDLRFRKEIVLPVFTLGLPLAFSTILMSVSQMIANHMMIQYGSIAVAAQGVAGRVAMLISMVAMGICMGMQPAVSYNYAAGEKKRLRMIIRNTGITTAVVGSVLSVFCFVFKSEVLRFFIDNAQVLKIGKVMLTAAVLVGPVYGLYQLGTTYLQATGKAGYATTASLLNKGLLFLPVLFLLHGLLGMHGIIYASAVTDAFSIVVTYGLCILADRKEKEYTLAGEE